MDNQTVTILLVQDKSNGRRLVVLEILDGRCDVCGARVSQERDDCVADAAEDAWAGTGPDSATVLVECHIADVVQTVLDVPVSADQVEHGFRTPALSREAGDVVERFTSERMPKRMMEVYASVSACTSASRAAPPVSPT